MRRTGLSEQAFREQVLGKLQLTLREWKQDVARPQLLLKKLSSESKVSDADVRAAFEARHGARVEYRAIVLQSEEDARCVAKRIPAGETTFEKEAERRSSGLRPASFTIPRHASNPEAWIKVACLMKPGEVSGVIKHNGNFIILECRRRIPADTSVRFEDVR